MVSDLRFLLPPRHTSSGKLQKTVDVNKSGTPRMTGHRDDVKQVLSAPSRKKKEKEKRKKKKRAADEERREEERER